MHKFITELRKARIELGISMRQVERDTGLSRNHLVQTEQGKYNITIRNGLILCDYYGIDVNLFVDYKNYMTLQEMKRVSEELEISLQYTI